MMEQTLTFHPAWLKTIAKEDKIFIEKMFKECEISYEQISFTTVRVAKNYKGQLLVTVLIHNGTEEEQEIRNKELTYVENGAVLAKENFSIPMVLPRKTSTPWTFIFSDITQWHEMDKNGQII
jgi:SLAP domain-containing protein